MHVFLTGEKHVGKSTLVRRVLDKANVPYGGILSVSELEDGIRRVYLKDIHGEEKRLCGICVNHHIEEKHPEVFDSFGVEILKKARNKSLVVIDEIGNMEGSALSYNAFIQNLLASEEIVVFGVLQNMAKTELASVLRRNEHIQFFEVNTENRESLVDTLAEIIKKGCT